MMYRDSDLPLFYYIPDILLLFAFSKWLFSIKLTLPFCREVLDIYRCFLGF